MALYSWIQHHMVLWFLIVVVVFTVIGLIRNKGKGI